MGEPRMQENTDGTRATPLRVVGERPEAPSAAAVRSLAAAAAAAGEDPRDVLAAWLASEGAGASTGAEVAGALSLAPRTAARALAAYRRVLAHGACAPPLPPVPPVAALAAPARGKGGGLPSESVVFAHPEHSEAAEARSARRADEEAARAEADPALEDVIRGAARNLRDALRLAQADIDRCLGWLRLQWPTVRLKRDPYTYGIAVALNRAAELGLRRPSGRESVQELVAAKACPRCRELLVARFGFRCRCSGGR